MMERSREGRRVNMAASNGLSRRRHRSSSSSSSLRDSPEDDGPVEFHETAGGRLKKDRGGGGGGGAVGKKDREGDRMMMMMMMMVSNNSATRSSKRLRAAAAAAGEGLLSTNHHHHHHMTADDISDEEEEEQQFDDYYEEGAGAASSITMLPPNNNNNNNSSISFPPPSSSSSSLPNHNHNNHHRKCFPPYLPPQPSPPHLTATAMASVGATVTTTKTKTNKVFRSLQTTMVTASTTAFPWKATDEMIGVSVPRKARSASTKRSHESWASSGGGAVGFDQIHRQAYASQLRSSGPNVTGFQASTSSSPTIAPVSPSSSNPSVKKKMKPNGAKYRPPKSYATKSASSTQDEIEIEIAEVLYGLTRQPQGPTIAKQEASSLAASDSLKFDSREVNNNNKSAGDAKSSVSSPISNSPPASTLPAHPSSSLPYADVGAGSAPSMSAIVPKRKRPRPVMYEDENATVLPFRSNPISPTMKVEEDQPVKVETCSPKLDNTSGSVPALTENIEVSRYLTASQGAALSSKEPQVENTNEALVDSKPLLTKEMEGVDTVKVQAKDEPGSPKLESLTSDVKLDEDRESLRANKGNSSVSEVETTRGEKFAIDLMAPPPLRSFSERDSEIDCVVVGPISMVTSVETERMPPMVKVDDKGVVKVGEEDINLESAEEKAKVMGEVESQEPVLNKETNNDLQLNLEKPDRDTVSISVSGSKLQQHQPPPPNLEKPVAAQTNSLTVPMSIADWPGGLPHMGYVGPLPGVVSMEVGNLSSAAIQPPHFLFSQQRQKRCATHCYIAKNIHHLQQFTKMNPFWSSAAGSALPYWAKMGVLPSTDLHAGRGVNPGQEKGQGLTVCPGQSGKDKNSSGANTVDAAQRKQILLQQPLPPGASSNSLHSPAFIFRSQQQAVAAASVQPGIGNCAPTNGGTSSSTSSSSASIAAAATAVAGVTPMSFNCPSMAANETPYLAILQNGTYPTPIPAHMGTAPAYRVTHPQAMPFFNGSIYSSQMLHPVQIQQQPPPYLSQGQQSHQIRSTSAASTSSQKHLQKQQQKLHVSGVNGGGGNFQGFPAQNNHSLQCMQFQQWQQLQKPSVSHHATKHNSEVGNEDSRVMRPNTNIYVQNIAVPISPPNFTLRNPGAMPGANGGSSNPGDKKQQQPQSLPPNGGVESLPSQAFAMSFASINGAITAPGFDISSIAQNPVLQSFPNATKHGFHFMAAASAQSQQQKKSCQAPDEGKTGRNDLSKAEEDRKGMAAGKIPSSAQSITFSRPDNTDASVTSMAGSTVIESSVRALNLGSICGQSSGSVISSAAAPGMQQQLHRAQQQQIFQLQKHQQFAVPTSTSVRSKAIATSNGNAYSEHISSSPSSVAAKFPNALSAFSQGSVPSRSSSVQSPQCKNSAKRTTSQPSASSLSSNSSALKDLPQQQSRFQQSCTQISFVANHKSTTAPQGQPIPASDQSPSSPIVVSSPTTSISKSAGGSSRTTSTSTGSKGGHSSTPLSQQVKNYTSLPIQKSSPVAGRNVPSIFGHPHVATSLPSSTGKAQLSQQQPSKLTLSHSQVMYSGPHLQLLAPQPVSLADAASATSVLGLQRYHSEQQHPHGASATLSTLCPLVTLTNINTTDPATAFPYPQFATAESSGKPH